MSDEQFVMSQYASKTDLYEAKAKYYMEKVDEVRAAFMEYVQSEGCGCCRSYDEHKAAADKLGKLLNFKRYSDDSGWDFYEGKYDD